MSSKKNVKLGDQTRDMGLFSDRLARVGGVIDRDRGEEGVVYPYERDQENASRRVDQARRKVANRLSTNKNRPDVSLSLAGSLARSPPRRINRIIGFVLFVGRDRIVGKRNDGEAADARPSRLWVVSRNGHPD